LSVNCVHLSFDQLLASPIRVAIRTCLFRKRGHFDIFHNINI